MEESKTDFQGASRSAAPRRRSMMDRVKAMLRVRIDYIKGAWPAELAVLKKGAWWV